MDIYSLGILYYVFNILNNQENNNQKKYEEIYDTLIDIKKSLCKKNKIPNTIYNGLLKINNNNKTINLPNIIKKCLTHNYKDLDALIKDLNQIK